MRNMNVMQQHFSISISEYPFHHPTEWFCVLPKLYEELLVQNNCPYSRIVMILREFTIAHWADRPLQTVAGDTNSVDK